MTAQPVRFLNRTATVAQQALDQGFREKVAEAMRAFEGQRVPGVAYDVSSLVTAAGQLVITFSPRGS